jgi:hypothetical protein
MAKKEGWQKGLGKFSKDNDMKPVSGGKDNPYQKGEDISKVTYGDNVGPALPRGTRKG